ncbi:MAG TPA: L,D-transpeptidase family protein [Gaiellaceae bacterium]|nr:L,D-transpeptidase family protein [Gaiellaceae bacterium]
MGRCTLAVVAALAVVPAARAATAAAPCGVTASVTSGAAPLAVTLTALCSSSTYAWDLGDGTQATGQTVQHVFAAGAFTPQLTTDAGSEPAAAVTSIALRVTAPARARYGQVVTLRATVVPALPVTLGGRPFVDGRLRVRVVDPRPLVAAAGGVAASPVRITVVPRLTVATVGTPTVGGRVRVVATLRPAHAGRVAAPKRVSTAAARRVRVVARTRPAPGWAAVTAERDVDVVQPTLALGARGWSVRVLERRLGDLRYAIKRDGYFGLEDLEAVYAFQKVLGLPRTGRVDVSLWRRLATASVPRARYGGDHVEVDKARQVLFVVRKGKVALTVATSTGATGNTPLGRWSVYRKVAGFDWVLYYPSYFLRGFAVHGYPDVPPYPASHGCARIPMWIARTVYDALPDGATVYVYA